MICNHWTADFRCLYGEGDALPKNYFCADVETSGFNRKNDVIVEWGHCLVHDGEVTNRINLVLNWYESKVVSAEYLDRQLWRVGRQMELNGKAWRLTPEIVKAEGIPPREALEFIHEILMDMIQQRMLLVMHNGWNFDVQMLTSHFEQDLGIEFDLGENCLFDTGAVEKASQLIAAGEDKALPKPGETLKTYFARINYAHAPGAKWNVEYCVKKYGLDVARTSLHTAGEDAYALYLLMEKFRELLNGLPAPVGPLRVLPPPLHPRQPAIPISAAALAAPAMRIRGQRSR